MLAGVLLLDDEGQERKLGGLGVELACGAGDSIKPGA
jgi:hypothetical protein